MDILDSEFNYDKEENEILEFLLDMKEFYHDEEEIFIDYEEVEFSSSSKRDFGLENPLGNFDDEDDYGEQ